MESVQCFYNEYSVIGYPVCKFFSYLENTTRKVRWRGFAKFTVHPTRRSRYIQSGLSIDLFCPINSPFSDGRKPLSDIEVESMQLNFHGILVIALRGTLLDGYQTLQISPSVTSWNGLTSVDETKW